MEEQLTYYQVSSSSHPPPLRASTIAFFQAGVGTYFAPGVVSPLFQWAAQVLDEAIAWYLYQHVEDGYQFLMQNYNVGDKVLLFGTFGTFPEDGI